MNGERPFALVVEDDRGIRRAVQMALVTSGWSVRESETLAEAMHELRPGGPGRIDLVVVDLGLPDSDGIDLIRALRETASMPVIVLSTLAEEREKRSARDASADDYVEKPFRVDEFLARVRAHSRRHARGASEPAGTVVVGDVELDAAARVARKAGREVHLTPTQYRLFGYRVANAGRVLTHRQLLREVGGPGRVEHAHDLRVFMAALRQKLEADPAQPTLLVTETGVGCRLIPA